MTLKLKEKAALIFQPETELLAAPVFNQEEPVTFSDPLEGICNDQRAEVLRYVANELGDEWVLLARCLQLKSSRLQNIQRHAERHGFNDMQMKLEMLACWFKTQPRAVNKASTYTVTGNGNSNQLFNIPSI